jgi:hypothetical protein
MTRTVLFVEMPNFYANIERADHPELVDRPIIVGGDPRKKGLVQSATAITEEQHCLPGSFAALSIVPALAREFHENL